MNLELPLYILSCDIGGTHITSSICRKSNWQIIKRTITRSQLDSSLDAKSIFEAWALNIQACMATFDHEITNIGIAMPGPFNYENGISIMKGQGKYESIYNLNVTKGIHEALDNNNIKIRYINDAAAFLQGELYASNRENEDVILGITLGTGLGSAVKEKGKKAFDANLWDTKYKATIFEEYLVTRWFTKRFYELKGVQEQGLKEIIENYKETTEFEQLIEEYSANLKEFIELFSKKHNSTSFVIGGNIAKAWNYINKHSKFDNYNIEIAQYAEKAALIGAASIFEND